MNVRAVAALILCGAGFAVSLQWPLLNVGAIAVCWLAAFILGSAALRNPGIASLRAAALGAIAAALIALIVGALLSTGTDLPFDIRVALQRAVLGAAAAPATYWLLLYLTGGFRA